MTDKDAMTQVEKLWAQSELPMLHGCVMTIGEYAKKIHDEAYKRGYDAGALQISVVEFW